MASKRDRDDEPAGADEINELKRQKSYTQILSLLDEDEEEPIHDLSSIITTLQQEISSPSSPQNTADAVTTATHDSVSTSSSSVTSSDSVKETEEEGESERVMRHLLQASDDELGIPAGEFLVGDGVNGVLPFCDAFWELEDEAANYYTLFQSQLFM